MPGTDTGARGPLTRPLPLLVGPLPRTPRAQRRFPVPDRLATLVQIGSFRATRGQAEDEAIHPYALPGLFGGINRRPVLAG